MLNMTAQSLSAFETLAQHLEDCLENEDQIVAIIMLEVSNLSRIDARFGRSFRNDALNELSRRLNDSLRPIDFSIQTGDNTFAVVVPGLKNKGHATLACRKFIRVAAPETSDPERDKGALKVRVGVALYPEHSYRSAELLQRAQLALEVAKDTQQDLVTYDTENVANVAVSWEMRDDLAEAIHESELQVFFQPKLNLLSGETWGAEALVRWFSATRGPVSPETFIAVAEESDLIQPLTRLVLNSAMRSLMMWQRDGHDIGIAVNLPASMLLDSSLVNMMESLLTIWDIEPRRLTLELTESAIMADVDKCFATMSSLKALGTRISIDDFGTGYSSFSYFKTIPADELKIDRAFVAGMVEDDADQHIVETIIGLAHRFNLKVVAEGIEDEATIEMLKKLDCDVGQGYHIARPMPENEFDAWLDARRYLQPEI